MRIWRIWWGLIGVWLALLGGAAGGAPASDTPASLLIRGGTVVDGTGTKGKVEDVRVQGEKIVAVGRLTPLAGERVLDAKGLTVTPGFIDTHSHADGGLLDDPDAEAMIRQGITTSVVGQDGSSHFPLRDWFAQLEARHVALNIASFVGHGTMRRQVMGDDYKRAATPAEVQKMQALVAQEMDTGAMGLSSGLEYDPGFYSTTDELVALAQVAGRHGGLYISHVRDEGDKVFDAFRELITIGREGHLPAQISHIKLDTTPVWHKAGDALRLMDAANRAGQDVSADVYPYTFWQSTITVLIPTRNWDDRAAWTKGLAEVGGAGHILLTSYTPDPTWQGKTVAEIADMTHQDPVTVIQTVVARTHGKEAQPGAGESVVVTAMTEDDLTKFIASPRIMFCTDGSLHPSHPRGAGSFPRVLARYVRERHVLTLEQAIHKMTGLPAARMGFRDRGAIRPGMKADLVLFDARTVRDTATTAQPASPPVGLPDVFVNGVQVLDQGKSTGAHPGEVLRRT
ncbi:MAG: D-aminoacylase [Armatimonadetes bacterium]|nr:D-aminoacylase [Armatimonadota bacterium]